MELLQELWDSIKETIQKEYELSAIAYKTWIQPLELVNVIGQTVYIRIPSDKQQALNYIQNKFSTYFQVIIAEMVEIEYEIEFILNNKDAKLVRCIDDLKEEINSNLSGLVQQTLI